MSGRVFLGVTVAIGAIVIGLPAAAFGAGSVAQDSCSLFEETTMQGSPTRVEVFFPIVNLDLPPICGLNLHPLSPTPECIIQTCWPAHGWSCQQGGGAVWRAIDATACILPGSVLHGFSFVIERGTCCYLIEFTGAQGEVLFDSEDCFGCTPVGVEREAWGRVKKLFH